MRFKVKVIGIGGIGGRLLPVLTQHLKYKSPESVVTLIDGDAYELENAERQVFDRIGNKAEVTASRLASQCAELEFTAVAEYLNEKNAARLIREGDVVFVGVDNHKTRKVVSDRARELNDVVIISGGNELTDGNVQVYLRKSGKDLTLPLGSVYHPEIAHPQDHLPGEHCEERAVHEPQLVITNNAIAAAMLNAFYAWTVGKLDYDELYVDILTGAARPVTRRQVVKTAA